MNKGSHFSFMEQILADLEKHSESLTKNDEKSVSKTSDLVAAFKKAFAAEDIVFKQSQSSLISKDIAETDSLRDSLYAAFKKNVKSYLGFPNAEKANAAKKLNKSIKTYRVNVKAQMDKVTGELTNLVDDLENALSAEVETLGLTDFVNHLKEANNQVKTLLAERTEERKTLQVGALKAARNATDKAYRTLIAQLNALAIVFGDADYADFFSTVNGEITRFKRQVLKQKGSSRTSDGSEPSESSSDSSSSSDKSDASDKSESGSGSDSSDSLI